MVALLLFAPQAFGQRQMETLGRGVVAVRTNSTRVYIGWRMLGTDPDDIGFNLYRVASGATNKLNTQPLTNTTDYVDSPPSLTVANSYFVRPVTGGVEQSSSALFTLPASAPVQPYLSIPLQIPPAGTNILDEVYTYSANDCSAGDVDGDGEYEIILKWDPSNAKDNSQSGFTGPVYIDAYKLDGTRLWRINLGLNIRAGAHYTQFMVYDLDGDGKAEVACKTAPGTVDGQTNNVIMPGDEPSIVYTNSEGYILTGPEYLTIFNGLTGAAMFTTNYVPTRGLNGEYVTHWGDSYGNRVDRFLACVAYLDGQRPSLVMCRGYYGPQAGYTTAKNFLVAWNWRNGILSHVWTFEAALGIDNNTNVNYVSQGNHNLSVGDVDGDGKDEIVYGACAIDDNGSGLYTTGLGHGDAMHMSDLDPSRPGLERWGIHEGTGTPGSALFDAGTGEIFWQTANADVGRGVAADLTAAFLGDEVWGGTSGLRSIDDQYAGSAPSSANFAVWWDADLLRELEDGTSVAKYGGGTLLTATNCASNNGTKSTPCLAADLLGDWREEVIWRTSDDQYLRIYTTIIPATNRFYTLMHDPQYRMAIAWQNVAYNQPPHPGFYLGDGMAKAPLPPVSDANLVWRGGNGGNAWDVNTTANWLTNGIWINNTNTTVFANGRSVLFDLTGSNNVPVNLAGTLQPGVVTVHSPADYVFGGSGSLVGTMKLTKAGSGTLTLASTNTYTGATLVAEGTLLVNGTLSASLVTFQRGVWHSSRVGGRGLLGQGLTVQPKCGIVPGGINSAGTLTVSNHITLLGDAIGSFDLSSDPTGVTNANDRVNVVGNLSLSGTNTIEINQLDGFLGGGVYTLITYTGSLAGGLSNLVLSGDFVQPVALTNWPGAIGLVAVFPDAPPAAPSGLTATVAGANQINLAWTDNATNEDVFLIERSTNDVTFAQIALVSANDTSYSDIGLSTNSTYYYRVRAHNLAGDSDYSNTASPAPPVAPGNLTATTIGAFQINLAWVDNSTDESSFLIERSTNNVVFTQIASVSANVTNYSDIGLSTNTTYYYRVRAHNLAGDSDYSNTANATTLAAPIGLTWRGDGTANVWDIATTANWFDGTNLVVYSDGALVTFDNTGSNNVPVSLVGTLSPADVIVNASKDYALRGSGRITGTAALLKSGSGSLTITNTHSFSGGTTIGGGAVVLGSIAANLGGLGTGPVVFEGGTLQFYGYAGAGGTDWGGHTNDWVVAAGQVGAVRMPPRFGWGTPFTSRLTGEGTLQIVTDYVRCGFGGDWSDFAGQINVGPRSSTAEFRLNNSLGLPNASLYLSNSITMYHIFGNTRTISIGELAGAAGATLGPGNGSSANPTWRVGGKNTDATYEGQIVDAGVTAITKVGTGTWTLTGTNTYTGATTVSGGTLLVNGNQADATGTVTVGENGTLGGTGTIGGATTVNGTLAPGTSIGTLTITNSVTLAGVTSMEVSKAPLTNDLLNVGSLLTYGGTLVVTNTSATPLAAGDSFKLFDASGYDGAFAAIVPPTPGPGLGWKTSGLATDGTLAVVRVPVINQVAMLGTNLVFSGTNGSANDTYYVLASTNVASPLSQWTRLATNQFSAGGQFAVTNAVDSNLPQRFYLLQVP